jgi:hypothetical protein
MRSLIKIICFGLGFWGILLACKSTGPKQSRDEKLAETRSIASPEFRFQDLRRMLITQEISNVDDMVVRLKREAPEFLENFVLVHDSFSLQKSTPKHPRAILFSNNADLILTYNGSPESDGFGTVETIEWESKAGRYIFREILFPKENPAKAKELEKAQETAWEYDGKELKISQPNPQKCTSCKYA